MRLGLRGDSEAVGDGKLRGELGVEEGSSSLRPGDWEKSNATVLRDGRAATDWDWAAPFHPIPDIGHWTNAGARVTGFEREVMPLATHSA